MMKRAYLIAAALLCGVTLALLPLPKAQAAAPFAFPRAARAGDPPRPESVDLRYYRGALLRQVKVSALFVGNWWTQGSDLHDYLHQFFADLFADGRYMGNLGQYSAGGYQIGSGALVGSYTHAVDVPARVTDTQIEAELRGALAHGLLPPPTADSLYFVFTPPGVVVNASGIGDSVQGTGSDRTGWFGYHSSFRNPQGGRSAYAVVPYDEDYWFCDLFPQFEGDPQLMTSTTSHELAEAVTDPFPTNSTAGWVDPQFKNGDEIGDIPEAEYSQMWQTASDNGEPPPDASYVWDVLTSPAGQSYLVQKVWSRQDGAPVAFAAQTGEVR